MILRQPFWEALQGMQAFSPPPMTWPSFSRCYLNEGSYGGRQYLKPSTVRKFTSRFPESHRGLGFDKPSGNGRDIIAPSASRDSYGHTGFTGTCVWVDPEQQLVYVFLSNRVYPNARNQLINKLDIRERIHQVVYDAIIQDS